MNLFALSGILLTATGSIMASIMLWKGKTKTQRLWAFFCLSVLFWGVGSFQIATTKDSAVADFWWRVTHIGVILIPVLFIHFVYQFLEIKKTRLIFISYILAVLFLVVNFIDGLFIANMRWVFGQFYYDSPPGPFYIPFTIYFFGLVIYSHVELWKAFRKATGVYRTQIKYFFFGMAISFAGGGLSFLPVYQIDLYPYFNILTFLYPIIIGYAIIRYRLLDIRIAVRKVFAYIILGAFSYAIFYGVAYTYKIAFGDVFAVQGFVVGTVISFLFAAATPFIFRFAVALSNKFLYTNIYNAQETFRKTTEKLTTIVKLQDLVDLIIITISSTLGIKNAAVLLRSRKRDNTYQVLGNIGFDKKNGISLVRDNFLTRWMDEHAKALVQEELFLYARDARTVAERTEYETLQKRMEGIKAALCLPLIVRGHLYGLIVLGEKKGGEAFTKEDMETLETLSNQAAVALENAVLYNRMEMLVEERTKALEEKNIHLEKLLQMRSEFLDIASHQLRTPVSVIKGYVSMLIDGDYDDTDKQTRKEAYNAIEQKTSKLVQIINDILYASEFDTGGAMLHKREYAVIPINAYVQKIVETHESTAREKHIALIFEQSNEKDLCVRASERYLEVILDNLIDNSLHYTNKNGTITVRVAAFPERVRIEVQDTGIGISKDDQKELFQKFKRGANANNLHTDGSGLGLFIVKKMVESQPDGSVGFESELNQGSTFWIELERAAEKHEA